MSKRIAWHCKTACHAARCAWLLALAMMSTPHDSTAGVIHVPGDYPTIQEGLAVATSGDTVLVAFGVFWGEGAVDLQPGVTLLGSGDWSAGSVPQTTIFIGGLAIRMLEGAEPSVVENVWFWNDYVRCYNPYGVIRRCRFGDEVGHTSADPVVWLDNGGVLEQSFICIPSAGGLNAIKVRGGAVVVRGNVINCGTFANALSMTSSPPPLLESALVLNNTFTGQPAGVDLYDVQFADVRIVNNIFFGELLGGVGIGCHGPSTPEVAHNCFFPHFHWNEDCGSPADSNFVADPGFCGNLNSPAKLDLDSYTIHATSPCLGAGENGSDIGALGIGCGASSVVLDPAPRRLTRLAVHPNPVLDGARFVYEPTGVPLMLEIYSPGGRLVERLSPIGEITWNPPRTAPSGVYFAHLKGEGVSAVARFVVIR